MKIVALVAAKGESERVPRKNIRPFADTDLTTLKLSQLAQVKRLDGIVLSSESDEVLEKAKPWPDTTVHKRDSVFATEHVPMSIVYRHLAGKIDADVIVWVPVTNPLVGTRVYDDAIRTFTILSSSSFDCLLSVTERKDYLFYKGKPINFPSVPWVRSQDLHDLYELNLAVCILRREDMIDWGSLVGESPYFYSDPSVDFHDIDDMDDFELCEIKYKRMKEKGLI